MPDRWRYDHRAGLVVPVDEQGERISPPPYICRGIAPGKGPLIAAAPDLLAACEAKQALDAHCAGCPDCNGDEGCQERYRLAEIAWELNLSAIAKVREGGEGG